MLKLFLIFIFIIVISIIQPIDMILSEGFVSNIAYNRTINEDFLVPNIKHAYNWYQGGLNKTHVYNGTQDDDEHTFNPQGEYVKDIGSKDYVGCRNKGYTKEFCLQTPYTRMAPGTCMCDNGQLGKVQPGFKGKCVCNTSTFGAHYMT